MAALIVHGKRFDRVLNAKVRVGYGDALESAQYPLCQFVITLPLDRDTTLASWALAPQGPDRYKMVELQIMDRSNTINHIWTLHKAYVHHYREVELPPDIGANTDTGYFVEIEVRGILKDHQARYDGKNILQVAAGASASPAN